MNHVFTSKLSFTSRSKANLVLSVLNAAVYFLSFSWRDELWTVTVSLSFPQVTYEYAAPVEEQLTGEDRSEKPPAVTLWPP